MPPRRPGEVRRQGRQGGAVDLGDERVRGAGGVVRPDLVLGEVGQAADAIAPVAARLEPVAGEDAAEHGIAVFGEPAGVDQLRDLRARQQLPRGGAAMRPHVRGGLRGRAGAEVVEVGEPLEHDRLRLDAVGRDRDVDAVVIADGDPGLTGTGEREGLGRAVDRERAFPDLGACGAPARAAAPVGEPDLQRRLGQPVVPALAVQQPRKQVARRVVVLAPAGGVHAHERRVGGVHDVDGVDALLGVPRPAADRGRHAGDGVDGKRDVRQRGLLVALPVHFGGLALCVGLVIVVLDRLGAERDELHRVRDLQPAALAAHAFQLDPRDLAADRAWVDSVSHRPALARRQRRRNEGARGIRVAHERLGEAGLAADREPHAVADGRAVLVARVVDHDGVLRAGRKPPATTVVPSTLRPCGRKSVRMTPPPTLTCALKRRSPVRVRTTPAVYVPSGTPSTTSSMPRFVARQSSTVRSSARRRSGSASASMATIRPPVTVKPMTENGRPLGVTTTPATPLISAGRTNGARRGEPGPRGEPRSRRRGRRASPRALVGAQHDVGVQDGDEALEVAVAGGGEERVDDAALLAQVRVRRRGGALHAAARAAGELTRGGGGAVDHRPDLVERHGEHVVQDEGQPLGGGERLEHDQQREPDRVGEQRLVLRVDGVGAVDQRVGEAHVLQRRLALGAARAQHVQRHARDDRRQPAAEVLDLVGVGAVAGAATPPARRRRPRCENPACGRRRPAGGAVLVEAGGQEVFVVHLVTFLVRGGSGH